MNIDLFCYGTLLFPEVLRAVTGRDFDTLPAVLHGHARYTVRGVAYPALVEEPGRHTRGLLVLGIDPRSQRRLDRYEGHLYEKREVRVETSPGQWQPAITYLLKPGRSRLLSTRPWSSRHFARKELARYLRSL